MCGTKSSSMYEPKIKNKNIYIYIFIYIGYSEREEDETDELMDATARQQRMHACHLVQFHLLPLQGNKKLKNINRL